MIFNLLPLPPLDGSRILSSILPRKASLLFDRIEPYGIIIMMLLLITGALQFILYPLLIISLQLN